MGVSREPILVSGATPQSDQATASGPQGGPRSSAFLASGLPANPDSSLLLMGHLASQGRIFSPTSGVPQAPTGNHCSFEKHIHVGRLVKYFDEQVLNYDAERLCSAKVFTSSTTHASLLRKRELKRDVLIIIFIAIGSAALCGTGLGGFSGDSDKFEGHLKLLGGLANTFHGIVTFLLGFFVSSCVGRWWSVRNDAIGGLWGAMSDLSLLVSAYFPQPEGPDREVRERVLRWALLSHELIYKQARAEGDLGDLVESGLLTDEEAVALGNMPSRPQVVWSWMTSYFSHLAYGEEATGGGRLPLALTTLPMLHGLCCKARGAIGAGFALTDTQLPFRYTHLLSMVVWVHNIIQAVTSGFNLEYARTQELWGHLVVECIFLLVYPTLFLALLHLGMGMLNPLRSSKDVDFPRGAFTHQMRGENRAFQEAAVSPPYGRPAVWPGSTAERRYKLS